MIHKKYNGKIPLCKIYTLFEYLRISIIKKSIEIAYINFLNITEGHKRHH